VLFVVQDFVVGGAERHLLELWNRIDPGRFEVEIACLSLTGGFAPEALALRWPVHDLGVGRRMYAPSGVRGLLRLIHRIRSFQPDVIHGYLLSGSLFAALAGRACGVRAVVTAKRNVDVFEPGRRITLHRLAHRLSTHVTAVSRAVAESSVALGVPRDRITVIPNGVDTTRFAPAGNGGPGPSPAAVRAGGRPRIGSVGCLSPRKDYVTLLEALAVLAGRGREFEALLVGDGPERSRLESRARDLGLAGRVTFAGERADVERLLESMDVFVLSSREEGIPNALLEAMSSGRPVVATAVGGTPEVVAAGESGWLVPPASPGPLADALEEALSNPAEAARRGATARRRAVDGMDVSEMVRRHEEFYLRASGRGPS
jgi:glycosyltransferase involved in cell wall biosynthesis